MNHFQALSTFTDKLDFIGDIHGCYYTLLDLLLELGYKKINGIWQHPERIAIFIGDYIDRGENVQPTLELIKDMVDHGKALAILGNHEYNFVGIFSEDQNGKPLRPKQKIKQHYATIKNLSQSQIHQWIEWFKTLPIFLDFGKIRAVHASWRDDYIEVIKKTLPNNNLNDNLIAAFNPETELNKALVYVLKGPELPLPQEILIEMKKRYPNFRLKEGRIKWWEQIPSQATYRQATTIITIDKEIDKPLKDLYKPYPNNEPIIMFGHYSIEQKPFILRENLTCIDFAIYRKKFLAAYRYNGENKLTDKNLVWVKHNTKDRIIPPLP